MIDVYKVGSSFEAAATLSHPTTAADSNADATPTATAMRNGAVISWALTVTQVGPAGRYVVTGTVPSDLSPALAPGDKVEVFLAASFASVVYSGRVATFRVLSAPVYDWLFGATAPLTDKAGFSLAAAGLDAVQVEAGVNVRQALSPILGAAAGVLSGAATSTIVIKGGNVSTTRITATVDADGNRSAVTLNLPA